MTLRLLLLLTSTALSAFAAADSYAVPWSRCGGGSDYTGSTVCPDGYDCVVLKEESSQCVKKGYRPVPEYLDENPYESSTTVYPTVYPCPIGYPTDWEWPGTKDYPLPDDYPLPSGYPRPPDHFYGKPKDYQYRKRSLKEPNLAPRTPQSTGGGGSSFTAVVGAPGIELRLPIERLQAELPDVFNMFILGLDAMMLEAEDKDLSFYQISGIHGIPYIPWQYPTPNGGNPSYGYCTHDSVLFCTWHRPYLILIEQVLVQHAVAIAAEFTGSDGARYRAAAAKVRMPYWDWAASSSRVPVIATRPTITVVRPGPNGAPVNATIHNPLFSYRFTNEAYRARDLVGYDDLEGTMETFRGMSPTPLEQQSDEPSATLDRDFLTRRQNTFQLFSIGTIGRFSTDRFGGQPPPGDLGSVESIHNTIHRTLFGYMQYTAMAAFDPIFWLHHCQVDRLTSIYQAIHPDSRIGPLSRLSATFGFPDASGTEDINTPLYPFRHSDGKEWTSNDITSATSIFSYGYAYPEVPSSFQGQSESALTAFATRAMQALYAPDLEASSGVQKRSTDDVHTDIVRMEWLAHVIMDQSQVPGIFRVRLAIDDDIVGFVASLRGTPENGEMRMSGTLPLTQILLEKGIDLSPDAAVPFLRDHLSWALIQVSKELPMNRLPSLKVGVSCSKVTYYADKNRLPSYGGWSTYYEVTKGKDGGMNPEDTALLDSLDILGPDPR